MDDLVQHIVRELSFEGDLGEQFVLHLIGGCPDFPIMCKPWGFDSRRRPFIFII
jgi:hypothetical protein